MSDNIIQNHPDRPGHSPNKLILLHRYYVCILRDTGVVTSRNRTHMGAMTLLIAGIGLSSIERSYLSASEVLDTPISNASKTNKILTLWVALIPVSSRYKLTSDTCG